MLKGCRSKGIIILSFDDSFENSTDVRAVCVSHNALLEYEEGIYGGAEAAYAKGGAFGAVNMRGCG